MPKEEQEKLFYKGVGELIRSARLRKDINHDEIAEYVGLSRPSIINIENGRQKVLLHTLVAIAECLNITLSDLIPLKQLGETDINIDVKAKINQKSASESQLNKLEGFIQLSLLKKTKQ